MWYRCSNGAREHVASLYAADDQRPGLRQPLLASSSTSSSNSSGSTRAPEGAQVVQHIPVSTPRQAAIQQLKQGPRAASITAAPQPGAVNASSVSDQALASQRGDTLKQAELAPAGPDLLPAPLPQPPEAMPQAAAQPAAMADTPAITGPTQQQQQQQQVVNTSLQGPAPASHGSAVSPPRAASPPVVEVELQRASSSCDDVIVSGCSATAGRPASPCANPLLHWSEIWSGPGIPGVRRRHSSSSNSSSRRAAAPAATAAAPASGTGSPRCSSQRPPHVWWAGIEQSQPPHSPRVAAAAAAAGNSAAATESAASSSPAAAAAGVVAAQEAGVTKRKTTSKGRRSSSMDMRSQPQVLQMQQLPSSLREALQIQQQQQQVQLAQPLLSRSGSSSSATSLGPRTQQQQQQQQQQGGSIKWWLVGGAALAVISGSAVVAAYVTISYMMKAAMVYSFAWKAATGVAAAEGLAIGGWGCSSVRKQKAVAAATAGDLVRLQSQAAKELAALRGLLQQREAEHGQELTSLSTLNERLKHLSQSLRTENSNLQGALERAAAERKSLEAAAALQAAHAESGALVEVAAAHSERVVGEVAELARGQQQLVALVCELREDLLGLVSDKDVTDMLLTTSAWGVAAELADDLAAAGSSNASLGWLQCAIEPAVEQAEAAADGATEARQSRNSCNAAAAAPAGQAGVGDEDTAGLDVFVGNGSGSSSSNSVVCKPPGLRLKSVRGSVDVALAASIAETLQL